MVRAILDGRKTVTRRVVTSRHPISFVGSRGEENDPACWGYAFEEPRQHGYMVLARGLDERFNHGRVSIPCPFGVPGDRLYVREGFAPVDANGCKCSPREASFVVLPDGAQVYRDGQLVDPLPEYAQRAFDGIKWRPSIHMPRWASRILLEVIDVRVKRIDLPPEVSASVFERMISERQIEARQYRATGAELALGIRADAERQTVVIEAEAYRQAEQVRGESPVLHRPQVAGSAREHGLRDLVHLALEALGVLGGHVGLGLGVERGQLAGLGADGVGPLGVLALGVHRLRRAAHAVDLGLEPQLVGHHGVEFGLDHVPHVVGEFDLLALDRQLHLGASLGLGVEAQRSALDAGCWCEGEVVRV
jgi:hypothetical protein